MARPDDGLLTLGDVAKVLGRRPETVRSYRRYDDLPMRRSEHGHGELVISREDLDEWRSRPEIASMLAAGASIKGAQASRA